MKRLITLSLFILIYLFSFSIIAQTKTVSFGGVNDDDVYDVIRHNGLNYILGKFPTQSLFYINDSLTTLSCPEPSIVVLDDSFNLVNYYCILDSNGTTYQPIEGGKLAFDSISNTIYLAGTTSNKLKFGSDYIDIEVGYPSPFIVQFDLQLTPLWARTTYCSFPANYRNVIVEDLIIDSEGKPWFSMTVTGGAELVCFGNDSIYKIGRVYRDTLGFLRTSKSQFPSLNGNDLYTMNAIDSNRIIEVHSNLIPQTLQMVDSKMDTVIWKKIITSNVVRFTAVDFATRYLYTLSDGGTLSKYTLDDGNLIFQTTIPTLVSPLGLSIKDDGSKVYAFGQQNFFNRIHVLDDQGTVLETKVWGIEPFNNDSRIIQTKAFDVFKNHLTIYSRRRANGIYFGTDTFASNLYRNQIFFSKFDITNVLTSNKDVMKSKLVSIAIYPNPTVGIINIESSSPVIEIRCYDLHGKLIDLEIIGDFQQLNLPASAPKGIYFLEIITENQREIKKVMYN